MWASAEAVPYAIMRMRFIRGEISMAPMMTATEFRFSPTEAMKMAQTMMTMFVPVNFPPPRILSLIS